MESTPEQSAEGTVVVRVLSAVLERLVGANRNNERGSDAAAGQEEVTKFHALKPPSISILQYLERIHKYASCSTECFILALIYIDRLIQRNNFLLTELNVHRVVITGILLAAKFFDDAYYNNAYYAKVGGVLVSEMNSLEVEFLFRVNFSLHVAPQVYSKYHAELISHAVGCSVDPTAAAIQIGMAFNSVETAPYTADSTAIQSSSIVAPNGNVSAISGAAKITPSPSPQHAHQDNYLPVGEEGEEATLIIASPSLNETVVVSQTITQNNTNIPMSTSTSVAGVINPFVYPNSQNHAIAQQQMITNTDTDISACSDIHNEVYGITNVCDHSQSHCSVPYSTTVIVDSDFVSNSGYSTIPATTSNATNMPHNVTLQHAPFVMNYNNHTMDNYKTEVQAGTRTAEVKYHHPLSQQCANLVMPHHYSSASNLIQNQILATNSNRRLSAPSITTTTSGLCSSTVTSGSNHYPMMMKHPASTNTMVPSGCSQVQ